MGITDRSIEKLAQVSDRLDDLRSSGQKKPEDERSSDEGGDESVEQGAEEGSDEQDSDRG